MTRYREQCIADGHPQDAPAVTILARGGGSLEDLWAFNDERVVRAVVGHSMPVVCGVGHEVDVTLADFAADVRAPTPSAAAEIVVPDQAEFAAALRRAAVRLEAATTRQLAGAARELQAERRALERLSPIARLASAREQAGLLFERATRALTDRLATDRRPLDRAADALPRLAMQRLAGARAALDASAAALAVLGPQATLDRGYAIVRRRRDDAIVRDPAEAPSGTRLRIRVARGDIPATTTDGDG
jgi:exodeoxyribonuclease VII large subunit